MVLFGHRNSSLSEKSTLHPKTAQYFFIQGDRKGLDHHAYWIKKNTEDLVPYSLAILDILMETLDILTLITYKRVGYDNTIQIIFSLLHSKICEILKAETC